MRLLVLDYRRLMALGLHRAYCDYHSCYAHKYLIPFVEDRRRTVEDVTADADQSLIAIISSPEIIWMWLSVEMIVEGIRTSRRAAEYSHIITQTWRLVLQRRSFGCPASPCLPTERDRFINVSFNLTHARYSQTFQINPPESKFPSRERSGKVRLSTGAN